jgi:N utilization substance protein B
MGKRRLARILALNALFQMEVGKIEMEEAITNVLQEEVLLENLKEFYGLPLDKALEALNHLPELATYVDGTVRGVNQHLQELDELIHPFLKNWHIDRLAKPELTILRLALYEMLYVQDIPYSVSIDEAVELAKLFGEPDARRFVNGVLGKILKASET